MDGSLTNEEFGALVGCSASMVSRMRTGARRPAADLRDRITKTFGLDPAEVIEAYTSAPRFARFIHEKILVRDRACVLEHPETSGLPCAGAGNDGQHQRAFVGSGNAAVHHC